MSNESRACAPKHTIKNAGFSLVELIVTVAILGVAVGFAALSYSIVSKSNVNKTTGYISDALAMCRQRSMASAGQWEVVIENGCVEVVKTSKNDGTAVSEVISSMALPARVDVYAAESKGVYTNKIDSTQPLRISFNMLNGDIKDVVINSGSIKTTGSNYCYISCRYKDKKEQWVKIYYATGKHEIVTE